MKTLVALSLALIALYGCTSDVEKAERLGYKSVEQMRYIQGLGYKAKKDFDDNHSFYTDLTSTKFGGAGLGLNPDYLGDKERVDSVLHSTVWRMPRGIVLSADKSNAISVIKFRCDDVASGLQPNINAIKCAATKTDLVDVIKRSKKYCFDLDYSYGVRYYFVDNAFFVLNKEAGVVSFGLAKSTYDYFNGESESYYDCSVMAALYAESEKYGFPTVSHYTSAKKLGYPGDMPWSEWNYLYELRRKYKQATGAFERAMVLMVSSRDDFIYHKNNGGLFADGAWNGYSVVAASVGHGRNSLKLRNYRIHVTFDQFGTKKSLTVDALKSILYNECGRDWRPYLDGTTWQNEHQMALCEISESPEGGYIVAVALKN